MKKLAASMAFAVTAAAFSSSASAAPTFGNDIFLDIGGSNAHDLAYSGLGLTTGDADTATGIFKEMGFVGLLATSVYDFTDGSLFGSFYDSNKTSVLAPGGVSFLPVAGTALDGITPVSLTVPTAAQVDIDALSPLPGPPTDSEGFNLGWDLELEYTLNGTLTGAGPQYTGGTIDVFFNELIDNDFGLGLQRFKALTLTLTGSAINLANLDLFFDVTFALPGWLNVNTKADGTGAFVDAATLVGTASPVIVALDTNVNPPIPTPDELILVDTDGNGTLDSAVRQGTLDGTIGFKIPEPGTLLLMGAGLLGASIRKRRR